LEPKYLQPNIGIFKSLSHGKSEASKDRFENLKNSVGLMLKDGINSLKFKLKSTQYTNGYIHVKADLMYNETSKKM
jgi:hypothetical protein